LSLSFNPQTFQHKIFQDLFIFRQQRRGKTENKGAKPPRRPKNREHKVNAPPTDIVPSLQANKPAGDII
jgi:hypothetical protein